jgi:hypothetical protein
MFFVHHSLFAIRQSLPFLGLTGGSCSCTTEKKKLFGTPGGVPSDFAPTRPKIFFGTAEAVPSSFSAVREHCPPETANSAAQESIPPCGGMK